MRRKGPLLILTGVLGLLAGCGWMGTLQESEQRVWWVTASPPEMNRSLEQFFGPGGAMAWEAQGPSAGVEPVFHFERDETIGRDVLVCDEAGPVLFKGWTSYEPPIEVSCLVRVVTTAERRGGGFTLTVAKDPADANSAGLSVALSASYNGGASITVPQLPSDRFRHSDPAKSGGTWPDTWSFGFNLRTYSTMCPTWDTLVRAQLEQDMNSLPLSQDKWLRIRFLLGDKWVRIWADGRLLLDHADLGLKLRGTVELQLTPGTRVAEMSVRPLTETGLRYEPIALDAYALEHVLSTKGGRVSLAANALPFGKTVTIDGIPFHFVDSSTTGGADHVDIGRSTLRQANMQGYGGLQSDGPRFSGCFNYDPARILLRIPNGRYEAMHVIAAFDEEPDNVPILSALFYRPAAGFAQVFEGEVPSLYATEAHATPLPVRLDNGKQANLWLVEIPLDPGKLSSFADMGFVELELTKKVHQYRSYPDPILYGWHQGGLPSGVHLYALTFQRPEVHMEVWPTAFGHVWTAPANPSYEALLVNRSDEPREVTMTVETCSHDGEEVTEQEQSVNIPAGGQAKPLFEFAVKKNGYHEIRITLRDGDRSWTEKRSFVRLAEDTRSPEGEPGNGPVFGYWSYMGGHYTPPGAEIDRLMKAAGARPRPGANAWPITPQWAWAGEEDYDREQYEAYKKTAVEAIRKAQNMPSDFVTFFPEPSISRDLTSGNLPIYGGEPDYELNADEQRALRVFFNTAKAAAEAVRAEWPGVKILIPWGDPLFIVPLLRAGFPKDLIDGSGLDICGFERLPEQQLHQISVHRLYCLKEEYRKFGMENPLLYYVEGIFVPTEPGACTWDEQADIYHRWALISMAYGVNYFGSGWFAFDCGDYYGSEHYGGCGIQRRIPYCDPKPAYAHYATMTRMLGGAKFEKWLPTGSHSTYCLKFARPKGGPAYALWTIRGKRPATLHLPRDMAVTVTDSMDNSTQLESKYASVTVMTGTSPVYVTGVDEIGSVFVGNPDHSDAAREAWNRNQATWHTGPAGREAEAKVGTAIASLGDGTWTLQAERDEVYETNNYDTKRYLGRMSAKVVADAERPGPCLAVHLEEQEKERQLMPWYSVLRPQEPVTIPGKALALGLWVKGNSDWGRVVYCLRDAKDERWISIGFKDQYNCDDVHSWSYFNFDGWCYIRFELPSHTAYDTFREYGTTWWRSGGGDGVVDLPLRIEKIIVERRTHVLYVNDIQPANPADVLLGDLVAEYGSEFDATDQAVTVNRKRMELPKGEFELPNPIADMMAANELSATTLRKVTLPDWGYDGTRCHVHFDPVGGAKEYQIWVAAHKDGRGAVQIGGMEQPGGIVGGLRPAMKLYLYVTYTTEDGKQSKPSNALEIELVDAFGEK